MTNTAGTTADMFINQHSESVTQIKPSLVIIGNGMATGRLLDEIIKRTPNKYQITVIGKEHFGSYNRIMLSAVLAGDATIDSIMQKPPAWYKEHNINFLSGSLVTYIDKEYRLKIKILRVYLTLEILRTHKKFKPLLNKKVQAQNKLLLLVVVYSD